MKRHRFDPYTFVFGVTFLVLGLLFLDTDVDVSSLAGGGWIPLPAVVLGLLLLAVGLDRARPARSDAPVPADEAHTGETADS